MEKARAACLACDHVDPSGHGGVASFDAMGERLVERERLDVYAGPRGQVTALPPDVEETTAELYRRWCGLDTIDALLMLHVCNGGTCAQFGDYLDRVRRTIERLNCTRDNYRATAWEKWRRLVARFAPFIRCERLQSWGKGHGGAKPGHRGERRVSDRRRTGQAAEGV